MTACIWTLHTNVLRDNIIYCCTVRDCFAQSFAKSYTHTDSPKQTQSEFQFASVWEWTHIAHFFCARKILKFWELILQYIEAREKVNRRRRYDDYGGRTRQNENEKKRRIAWERESLFEKRRLQKWSILVVISATNSTKEINYFISSIGISCATFAVFQYTTSLWLVLPAPHRNINPTPAKQSHLTCAWVRVCVCVCLTR